MHNIKFWISGDMSLKLDTFFIILFSFSDSIAIIIGKQYI